MLVTAEAAVAVLKLKRELEAAGKPIVPDGLPIAAHAYALRMPLVTADVDEFSRVRRLRAENWLE